MCMSSGSGSAPPPPPPQIPVESPRLQDPDVKRSRGDEKKRLRALSGHKKSIATSGLGVTEPANISGKQLTGQ